MAVCIYTKKYLWRCVMFDTLRFLLPRLRIELRTLGL
jgi:hypothetical protein